MSVIRRALRFLRAAARSAHPPGTRSGATEAALSLSLGGWGEGAPNSALYEHRPWDDDDNEDGDDNGGDNVVYCINHTGGYKHVFYDSSDGHISKKCKLSKWY